LLAILRAARRARLELKAGYIAAPETLRADFRFLLPRVRGGPLAEPDIARISSGDYDPLLS